MSNNTPEQLDELIRRAQQHADVSDWVKKHNDPGSVNLVSALMNIPKAQVEKPNLLRVRHKVLDRISLPADLTGTQATLAAGWMQYLPRIARVAGGVIGVFTVMLGLTVGTAAAALESVPGQPIYPLKKMVETFQMQLASTAEEKAALQIKFANNRIDELATILQKKKEGRATDEQVKKAVETTVKNLEATNLAAANQTEPTSKTELYAKIVSLSDRQTAVIKSAQIGLAVTEVRADLDKALESSKISKEQAIENIERAGLNIEDTLLLADTGDSLHNNEVVAEGQLTVSNRFQISIGTSQFLLTKDTEYVNIEPAELKVGTTVVIHGQVRDNKTYAVKIEFKPAPSPTPTTTPTVSPTPTATPADQTGGTSDNTAPLNP